MTPRFGLCDSCTHQKLVKSGRGSTFSMCQLGLRDPDWPKYPRMPVMACPRFAASPDKGIPNKVYANPEDATGRGSAEQSAAARRPPT